MRSITLRRGTDNALKSVFKPQRGMNLASTLSMEVCILSVCRRWMCVTLILDLITDFIRIILQFFRGHDFFSSIIIPCLLVADRGSCYHKMSNANNAETMSIISLTHFHYRTEVDSRSLVPSQDWEVQETLKVVAGKATVRLAWGERDFSLKCSRLKRCSETMRSIVSN